MNINKQFKDSYINAIIEKDPAATSRGMVKHTYAGYKALMSHRKAQWFLNHGMPSIARWVAYRNRKATGVDIHPAAKIGMGVFIDHGSGVVIGETAEVGNNVVLYQGVTLGGTGKDVGKRHPTVEDDVMISAGAKVLGPIIIGKGTKIGAGSVVLKSVPENCTVVGVPGRIVKQNNARVADMDQILLPDPILEEFKRISKRLNALEAELGIKTCRYSIAVDENEVGEVLDNENK